MNAHRYHTAARGFTLVELLVVISLIALLISILLPSLSKARERGDQISCSNRLRQMFMAEAAVITDNKGKMPMPYWYNNPIIGYPGVQSWVLPLFGGQYLSPRGGRDINNPYATPIEAGILMCTRESRITQPISLLGVSLVSSPPIFEPRSGLPTSGFWGTNFAMNYQFFGNYYNLPVAVDEVKQQSSLYFVGELVTDYAAGAAFQVGITPVGVYSNYLAFRHLDSMNMLYFDGHARAIKSEMMEYSHLARSWSGN